MTSSIQLTCDALRCGIIPALQGAVAGLCLGQTPALPGTPAAVLTSVRNAGSYPLVPFSSITNQSAVAAPVGLGWHPYFVKRADTHVRFAATGRWEMGDDRLPTRRVPSGGLDHDCDRLEVDHCFDGWSGALHLTDSLLHTTGTSNLHYVVVYTSASRDYVAVEPVSQVNNAVNLLETGRASAAELGVRVLQPGASMSAEMSIRVEHG